MRRSPDSSGLKRDSIALLGTAASSVGIQAPAAGVSFLPALMAGIVGVSGPFSFAAAVVLMLFVAYAFVLFSREHASAASVYAFTGRVLGARYGVFAGWLLLLVYVAFAASVFASNANALVTLVAPGLLGSAAWLVFAALLWAATMLLAAASVRVSTAVILLVELIALLLVAVVAVVVLAHSGSRIAALGLRPFAPLGVGAGALGPGIVFAFTGFSGFEVAATLGEESRAPRRVIPVAMVLALVLSGLIYAAMSYVETVAYPSVGALVGAEEHGVPLASIADRFVGGGAGTLVVLASIASGFGAQLATVNGAGRLLFAAGRAGVAPASLVRVNGRGAPTRALAIVAVATIVPVLALFFRSPLEAFGDLATYGVDLIIVAYLLTVVAALVNAIRRRSLVHGLVLAVGTALIAGVITATVVPLPAGAPLIYLLAAAVSMLVGLVIAARSRAGRVRIPEGSSPAFTRS